MTSFMSEHTVEFYVVPRLREILERSYPSALPIYFWRSREGSRSSRAAFPDVRGRLCALFARRPKFPTPTHVTLKVNAEVFDDAARLQGMGIPTFVGMPEVVSFLGLGGEFRCVWFSLQATEGEQPDFYFVSAAPPEPDARVRGPLAEEEIRDIVRDECREISWAEAVECMSELRTGEGAFYGRFLFGPSYKPVYFFMPDGDRSR
jgi:hypothetical protein